MPKPTTARKPDAEKKMALERIKTLFEMAATKFDSKKKLANSYVKLARKISMRHKVSIPSALKRKFCKHCHTYLRAGVNCRVRLTDGHVTYYCLDCKKYMRFGYTREQKAKRAAKK